MSSFLFHARVQLQENYFGANQYPVTSQEWERDGGRNLRSFHFNRKFRTCASNFLIPSDRVSTLLCISVGECNVALSLFVMQMASSPLTCRPISLTVSLLPLLLPVLPPPQLQPSNSIDVTLTLHVKSGLLRLPIYPDPPASVHPEPLSQEVMGSGASTVSGTVLGTTTGQTDSTFANLAGIGHFAGAAPSPHRPTVFVGYALELRISEFELSVRALDSVFDVAFSLSPVNICVPEPPVASGAGVPSSVSSVQFARFA